MPDRDDGRTERVAVVGVGDAGEGEEEEEATTMLASADVIDDVVHGGDDGVLCCFCFDSVVNAWRSIELTGGYCMSWYCNT
jgi:hypothetical protein